jgi:hypothetical protein
MSDFDMVPYHTFPDMTRPGRPLATAGLAASILVFVWPQLSPWFRGASSWYPLVTVLFTMSVVAIVVTWPHGDRAPAAASTSLTPAVLIVSAIAATIVASAAHRWIRVLAWQPYGADMLIVIREATRRFLNGRMPYTTYRTYDAPWNIAMPYGPGLWGPFLVPQLLRLDFRFLTIAGELFVPVWCGVAAIVESARGRSAGAAAWLAVLAALVLTLDIQGFTLIGHTPVYWPLLPLFAVLTARSRWVQAACLLGVLVVARTTMVAVVPVLLMAAWHADRRRFPRALAALLVTVAVVVVPFIVWDCRAIWDNMVLSYPRVMKESVWPVLARSGIETIGLTEWLLERHRESLVVPAQVLATAGVYGASWFAIRRRAAPLPWMALALFAFSMTGLYPVHYLYYDVLLLLVSGAIVETLEAGPVKMAAAPWLASSMVPIALLAGATWAVMSPYPRVDAGDGSPGALMRAGFAMSESDGQRRFSWIVGHDATIILPRRSADAAVIVLTVQSPFGAADASQSVTAILNGSVLAHTTIPAGWREIRLTAPRSTWWVGFNQLHLVCSSTVSPRDVGAGDDPRELALAVSRVEVVPLKE